MTGTTSHRQKVESSILLPDDLCLLRLTVDHALKVLDEQKRALP